MIHKTLAIVTRFILISIASVLLYFGLGMLFLVPGVPREPYWQKPRVYYGLVPLLVGIAIVVFSSWAAIRFDRRLDFILSVMRGFVLVAIGVVLVFALLAVNDLYFHVPTPAIPAI